MQHIAMLKVYIYIGGCSDKGKSLGVEIALNRLGHVYSKLGEIDSSFFDGYNPLIHDIMLLTDMQLTKKSGRSRLRLLDHYKFPVDIKNDSAWANFKWVVATTN